MRGAWRLRDDFMLTAFVQAGLHSAWKGFCEDREAGYGLWRSSRRAGWTAFVVLRAAWRYH